MRRAFVMAAALALATGCPWIQRKLISDRPAPTVTAAIQAIDLVEPSSVQLTLELGVEGRGEPFQIDRADFMVYASNRRLASIHTLMALEVPATGVVTTTLSTRFAYLSLPRRAQAHLERGEQLEFAVRGALRSDRLGTLPFDALRPGTTVEEIESQGADESAPDPSQPPTLGELQP